MLSFSENNRAVPRQKRSADRMQTILKAASELFAQHGYEATTTNAIAERAGTSIGSLYRFFPDKLAIFKALTQRYSDKVGRLIAQELGAAVVSQSLPDIVDTALDAFDRFLAEEPAFARLLIYTDASPELREIDMQLRTHTAQMLSMLMVLKGLQVPDDCRMTAALVLIELLNAYFRARTARPESHQLVKSEFKRIFRGYLESYLPAATQAPPKPKQR